MYKCGAYELKIDSFSLSSIKSELITPFVTNLRRVEYIEDTLLTIIGSDGLLGYGEAPPTVAITGEDRESIEKAIGELIFPAIYGMDIFDDSIFEIMQKVAPKNSSARACVDMAIYDMRSKVSKKPLVEYLGGTKKTIKTNLTISLNEPKKMLQDALCAESRGFSILKIKVGKSVPDALFALKEIRAALPNTTLRVDANQAWSLKDAHLFMDSAGGLDIELIEQPLNAHDLDGMRELTSRKEIKILTDESVFSLEDAKRVLELGAADFINIKLMKTGGIYEAKKIAALAKEAGKSVMMGSMLESFVSVTAAVHFGMSDENICFFDLDGPLLAKELPKTGAVFCSESITLNDGYGLGISF